LTETRLPVLLAKENRSTPLGLPAAAEPEIFMRTAIMARSTIGGLAAIGTAPAEAVGTRYPFCITGPEQPGLSNCTFTSYEQCQATASGRRLWCVENPYYAGGGDDPRAYGRRAPRPQAFPPPPGYRTY
jgi:hypothetical protein